MLRPVQSVSHIKGISNNFGHLPPKAAEATPLDKMCVNPMGTYTIRRKEKPHLEYKCITMIDPATGWYKMKQFDDKLAVINANIVEQKHQRPQKFWKSKFI